MFESSKLLEGLLGGWLDWGSGGEVGWARDLVLADDIVL